MFAVSSGSPNQRPSRRYNLDDLEDKPDNNATRERKGARQGRIRGSQQQGGKRNSQSARSLSPKRSTSDSSPTSGRGRRGRDGPLVASGRLWKSNTDILAMANDLDDSTSGEDNHRGTTTIRANRSKNTTTATNRVGAAGQDMDTLALRVAHDSLEALRTTSNSTSKETKPAADIDALALRAAQRRKALRTSSDTSHTIPNSKEKKAAVQDIDALALRAAQRRNNRRGRHNHSSTNTDLTSTNGNKRVSSAPDIARLANFHNVSSSTNTVTTGNNSRANATFGSPSKAGSTTASSAGLRGSLMKRLSDRSLGGLFSSSTTSSSSTPNDLLRSSIRAPAKAIAKTVVQAGSLASDAALSAGTNVSDAVVYGGKAALSAGTNVSDAVVYGSKTVVRGSVNAALSAGTNVSDAVVYGGKAAISAGTNVSGAVVYGGKTVVKGSVKAIKSMSKGMSKRQLYSNDCCSGSASCRTKKSKWEEAVEAMNEVLDSECPAFQHMTLEQKMKLHKVRKLLMKGHAKSCANKLQHVPPELILMQQPHQQQQQQQPLDLGSAEFSSDPSFVISDESMSLKDLSFETARSRFTSSCFILEEYAGVNSKRSCHPFLDVDEMDPVEETVSPRPPPPPPPTSNSPPSDLTSLPPPPAAKDKPGHITTMDSPTVPRTQTEQSNESREEDTTGSLQCEEESRSSIPRSIEPPSDDLDTFVPPEFSAMDAATQRKVLDTLRWDSIGRWDFNVFGLDSMTSGHAMLFAGWAILGAPHSQKAMARHVGFVESGSHAEASPMSEQGYDFMNELKIPPKKLYNYIKVIEQDYNSSNSYHCSTHGADVLLSLHCLIQKSVDQDFMKKGTKLQLFSILLAALVHDVGHFGTTNAFHKKLQTELTILYNDKSAMESWHVAHAFSRMLDLDLTTMHRGPAKDVRFSNFKQTKDSTCNVLCNATPEEFDTIRRLMIDAILNTDMTNHFAMVNATRELLTDNDRGDDSSNTGDTEDTTWRLFVFMLHMADISSQAKEDPLCQLWAKRCFDEFFAQGDLEAELDLPISPNCDRHKVMIPESQVGFIQFVVEPAFEVLGMHIPFVQDLVLPIIHSNKLHYMQQQHEADVASASAERRPLPVPISNRRELMLDESIQCSHRGSSRALAA